MLAATFSCLFKQQHFSICGQSVYGQILRRMIGIQKIFVSERSTDSAVLHCESSSVEGYYTIRTLAISNTFESGTILPTRPCLKHVGSALFNFMSPVLGIR